MKSKSYTRLEKVTITCKCGLLVTTKSVEYNCPVCDTMLVEPVGRQQGHLTHDYADNILQEQKRKDNIKVVKSSSFHSQGALREFILTKFEFIKFKYLGYTMAGMRNRIAVVFNLGQAKAKVTVENTSDNRKMIGV